MDPSLLHAGFQIELGFTFGDLRLEPDGTLLRGNEPVHLAPKELAALRVLLENPGRIVTPAQLKEILWPDVHVTADSLPRCISFLRSRIGSSIRIRTLYKRGYRLETPVHRHPPAPENTLPRLAIVPLAAGMCVPEHLGPAIAEEVSLHLAQIQPPIARVLARDSVFTLAGRGFSAHEVGRELNADLVLAGTLQTSAVSLRLRAEMVRVSDGAQLWVEDILAPRHRPAILEQRLLERLAYRLGGQVPIELSASAGKTANGDFDVSAYDAFLAGRQESRTRDPHRMQNDAALLAKAADLDRSAPGPREQMVKLTVNQCLYGYESPASAAEQIRSTAETVPEMGQTTQAILPALGWTLFHWEHNLAFALRMLTPSSSAGHDSSSMLLRIMLALSRWRFDEAHAVLEEALGDDPFSPSLSALRAWAHHLAGNANESLDYAQRSLALFPGDERVELSAALILAFNDNPRRAADLAHSVAQRRPSLDVAAAIEAYALARAAQPKEAMTILERLQWLGRERYVLTSFTAAAYAELGDLDGALAELQAAEEARCPWFFQTLADPRLTSLHGNPRFDRMRQQMAHMEDAVEAEATCLA